ncbi:BTAD domain-containing putative transcriptional regulator [Nocardioides sp. MAHUQ-72]|uniref:BTAD domain-containing putative transcriptional regulator n=1 Tax=unclassified Nocardioides TaxID=2615069 RepID=UPI0036079A3F
MRISVLGSTAASREGTAVDLGTPKQRALLAALALHHPRAVTADTLADLVWSGHPPPGVSTSLQAYVAGLRRVLEPDRPLRSPATVLVTEPPGYALRVGADQLDATAFESAAATAHRRLGPLTEALCAGHDPEPPGDLDQLLAGLRDALALWRGVAYADLGDASAAVSERARLEDLRLLAHEGCCAAEVMLGREATATAELESLTRQHPLRERLWSLRAIALARSGRQADALAALREVRDLLDEELGLEPGPELRAVQAAVLRQEAVRAPAAPGSVPTAPVAAPAPAVALPRRTSPWPLAGRTAELAALTGLLGDVADGLAPDLPAFAAITGEPGIGKSRLAAELADHAAARGVQVVAGRCSQDDGAPALWPWATVLGGLGSQLPVLEPGADDSTSGFRAWDTVVRTVLEAATRRPLLLLLDDLHWADTSSLRVLRLLSEASAGGAGAPRLMVVTTWREHPAPTGTLAEVAEALARRHALRLQLRGLTSEDAGRVVSAVAGADPSRDEAAALCRRTDGNPFFLVEYARLAGDRGDLAGLLAEEQPPVAVQEVLTRRMERLDDSTRDLLRTASVLGRRFGVGVLAATDGTDEDDVLDGLEPAVDAGLVAEDGVDRFRFTHALVRDAALATLPRSRRARIHVRAAEALTGGAGHEADVARHWLQGGPRYADRAWRACLDAAAAASRVHAHEEAVELLRRAVEVQAEDPTADDRDRFDLLVALADAERRVGDWVRVRQVAHRALQHARRLDDPDLLAQAGIITSTDALWQSTQHGEVDPVVTAALRDALDRLPHGDDPRRCRVMLALASEIYYGTGPAEREALATEAVAMARRLDDPGLTLWACLGAAIAVWRSETAALRRELTSEAVDLARSRGDDLALATALTLRTVAEGELGLVEEMERGIAETRVQAQRVRHLYAEMVLDSLEVSWLAMRGEHERADLVVQHMVELGRTTVIPQFEEAVSGAFLAQMLWQGRHEEMVEVLRSLEGTTFLPIATTIVALLCRAGRVEEAREHHRTHRAEVARALESDFWFSALAWSMAAEGALRLGDRELGAAAYERLAGLAGRPCCAGSGSTLGPVDMFLAMAAAATGEAALATRHADRAEELCETWRIPLAAQWLRGERDRYSF